MLAVPFLPLESHMLFSGGRLNTGRKTRPLSQLDMVLWTCAFHCQLWVLPCYSGPSVVVVDVCSLKYWGAQEFKTSLDNIVKPYV